MQGLFTTFKTAGGKAVMQKTDSIKSIVRSFGRGYNYVMINTRGKGGKYETSITPCDFRGNLKGRMIEYHESENKAQAEECHKLQVQLYSAAAKGNFKCIAKTVLDSSRDEKTVVVETNIGYSDKKEGKYEILIYMPWAKKEDMLDEITGTYKKFSRDMFIAHTMIEHCHEIQMWR